MKVSFLYNDLTQEALSIQSNNPEHDTQVEHKNLSLFNIFNYISYLSTYNVLLTTRLIS